MPLSATTSERATITHQGRPGHENQRPAARPALEWSRDTYIALLVLVAIFLHLILRFVLHRDALTVNLPLFVALLAGTPLLFELLRKLLHRQFGADLIAGVSVVSAA